MLYLLKKILLKVFHKIQLLNYDRFVTKNINGVYFELDLSENIDSTLFHLGIYERRTSKVLHRYINSDMIVFEVGANIGAHTFEIAKILKHGKGKLYSFEPTDYAFKKLKNNYDLNKFNNIVLEKVALSDTTDRVEISCINSKETLPFKASWDIKGGSKNTDAFQVNFEKLDDYVCRNEIDIINFLKIDVDGYELKVIKGGFDTIRMFKPIILIEVGITLERVGDKIEDLIMMLEDLGYSFYSIKTGNKTGKAELIAIVTVNRTEDFLCLPSVSSPRKLFF